MGKLSRSLTLGSLVAISLSYQNCSPAKFAQSDVVEGSLSSSTGDGSGTGSGGSGSTGSGGSGSTGSTAGLACDSAPVLASPAANPVTFVSCADWSASAPPVTYDSIPVTNSPLLTVSGVALSNSYSSESMLLNGAGDQAYATARQLKIAGSYINLKANAATLSLGAGALQSLTFVAHSVDFGAINQTAYGLCGSLQTGAAINADQAMLFGRSENGTQATVNTWNVASRGSATNLNIGNVILPSKSTPDPTSCFETRVKFVSSHVASIRPTTDFGNGTQKTLHQITLVNSTVDNIDINGNVYLDSQSKVLNYSATTHLHYY